MLKALHARSALSQEALLAHQRTDSVIALHTP